MKQLLTKISSILVAVAVAIFGFFYLQTTKNDDFSNFSFYENSQKNSSTVETVRELESENLTIEETIAKTKKVTELININTATENELTALPSIGPATAKNIVAYREKYGKFTNIEQIKNVTRIGEKTYQKIKALITID